jgi:hypothetical protein
VLSDTVTAISLALTAMLPRKRKTPMQDNCDQCVFLCQSSTGLTITHTLV